jgi:hypothetical protein
MEYQVTIRRYGKLRVAIQGSDGFKFFSGPTTRSGQLLGRHLSGKRLPRAKAGASFCQLIKDDLLSQLLQGKGVP